MNLRTFCCLLTALLLAACAPAGPRDRQERLADDDQDGIVNQLDRCPGTPPAALVDVYGCPRDSDGDGVVDGVDACPETPAGTEVTADGCPLDEDRDGVADAADRCPQTPWGVPVDTRGCPHDHDGDGVFDHLDHCPDTPRGAVVDPDGCPQVAAVPAAEPLASLELLINFHTGSARLDGDFAGEFARGAAFIRNYPGSRVTIEGHTDSVGPEAWNLKLSHQRAEVVRRELLQRLGGEVPIVLAGYGETRPVAGNETQQGRMQNRRVVIRIDPPDGR